MQHTLSLSLISFFFLFLFTKPQYQNLLLQHSLRAKQLTVVVVTRQHWWDSTVSAVQKMQRQSKDEHKEVKEKRTRDCQDFVDIYSHLFKLFHRVKK